MARIKIREFGKLQSSPPDAEEDVGKGVETLGVFCDGSDSIHVRLHRLEAGGSIAWRDSSRGHLVYVWEGAVVVEGHRLASGSVVVVEHGGSIAATADGPAALLVFNASAGLDELPRREGGHVHLIAAENVPAVDRLGGPANIGGALYADSDCASCELWLHGNDFQDADYVVKPHYHSEDEVIVVTGGEIVLGTRRYGRGTAIAIKRDTIYGFRTGPDGLSFINFRPSRPSFAYAGQAEPVDERAFYPMLPPPPHIHVGPVRT